MWSMWRGISPRPPAFTPVAGRLLRPGGGCSPEAGLLSLAEALLRRGFAASAERDLHRRHVEVQMCQLVRGEEESGRTAGERDRRERGTGDRLFLRD